MAASGHDIFGLGRIVSLFWPAIGVCAVVLVLLAWLSDRSAKRRGISYSSDAIARNIKEMKRERRQRMMISRRRWIPGDDFGQPHPPSGPPHGTPHGTPHRTPRRTDGYPPG